MVEPIGTVQLYDVAPETGAISNTSPTAFAQTSEFPNIFEGLLGTLQAKQLSSQLPES